MTLTLTGVSLSSGDDQFRGWGIFASGVDRFTLVGGNVSGYRSAVLLVGGDGHVVRDATLSRNRLRPVTNTSADFLDVWPEFQQQLAEVHQTVSRGCVVVCCCLCGAVGLRRFHGACLLQNQIGNGVVLCNCTGALVSNNVMQHQQNGVGLYGTNDTVVHGNVCSDNEGWGIHLRNSNNNKILDNRADNNFPKRSTYCHTVQRDGCDSAAMLVLSTSSHNLFQNNSFQNSGDGIFCSAFYGPTDYNIYRDNNCNGAKHIAVEATFTRANVFVGNQASHSGRYGFWLGFSRGAVVSDNRIDNNTDAGMCNDSGQDMQIVNNSLVGNTVGVSLYQSDGSTQESRDYFFARNVIADSAQLGLSIIDTHNVSLVENAVAGNVAGNVAFSTAAVGSSLRPPLLLTGNLFSLTKAQTSDVAAFNVMNAQGTDIDARGNWWTTTDAPTIAASLHASGMDVLPPNPLTYLEVTFVDTAAPDDAHNITLRRVVSRRADDATDARGASGPTAPANTLIGNAPDQVCWGVGVGRWLKLCQRALACLVIGFRLLWS